MVTCLFIFSTPYICNFSLCSVVVVHNLIVVCGGCRHEVNWDAFRLWLALIFRSSHLRVRHHIGANHPRHSFHELQDWTIAGPRLEQNFGIQMFISAAKSRTIRRIQPTTQVAQHSRLGRTCRFILAGSVREIKLRIWIDRIRSPTTSAAQNGKLQFS